MLRWAIPDDWTEENDGYTSVVFCIPNSRKWRGLITAHIDDLTWGRNWDEKTGSILGVQDISREVFASMTICDLQTELARIATATELMAANQPKLYTLAELQEAFGESAVVNWELIEAMLGAFGNLPQIKFDPLSYILEWIYRSQMLSIGYAQSTAQAAMAGALAKGLAIEGLEGVLGVADDVTDLIFQILQGGGSLAAGIAALATLFLDENEGEDAKVLQDVYVAVGGQSVEVNISPCGSCGSTTGCGCNTEIDGPVTGGTASVQDPCFVPDEFEDRAEFEDYVCSFANFVADKLVISARQFQLTYYRFLYDYIALSTQERLPVTEIYKKIAQALPEMVDPIILATIPNESRAELITLLTNHYVAFQDGVILEVPEIVTLEAKITEFWEDPFLNPIAYLLTNLEATKQDIYDAQSPTEVASVMLDAISDAVATGLGAFSGLLGDLLDRTANVMLGNMKFAHSTMLDGYQPDYECVGSVCQCQEFYIAMGTHNGGDNFSSFEWLPNSYAITIFFWYDEPAGPFCANEVEITVSNLQGHTPLGSPDNDFIVQNQSLVTVYEDASPPVGVVGGRVVFTGATPFSCDIAKILQ